MRKLKRLLTCTVILGLVLYGADHIEVIKRNISELTNSKVEAVQQSLEDVENLGTWKPEIVVKDTAQENSVQEPSSGNAITVAYVDVGQGDSIIIEDNDDVMVIDTGKREGMENLEKTLNDMGIFEIDVLMLTHPDADHIQNAPELMLEYGIRSVYMPTIEADTGTYQKVFETMNSLGIAVTNPQAGDKVDFGTADYEIVAPVVDEAGIYDDTNSYSLILKMVNGNDSFLFTGDATGEEVSDALATGIDVSADVYKVAHHGSANDGCNSEEFLRAVNPEYAVISCGYRNDYGHPHKETMELLYDMGCSLYRTDLQGTVMCVSTGNGYEWSTDPSTEFANGNSL